MAKTNIEPGELSKAVMNYLESYKEDIDEDVVEVTNQVTKQATQELKNVSYSKFGTSGRNDPYYSGWSSKISTRGNSKYHKVIWNKTNYQLTHLLEFGHLKRNGKGWVAARPHIRDIEQKYNTEFVDLIEGRIRRSSK